jgi:hypothetical protein
MKCTATEETMTERRLERLKHCDFFMRDAPDMPAHLRRLFGLSAAGELFTSFFRNSYYRASWHLLKKALSNSWEEIFEK